MKTKILKSAAQVRLDEEDKILNEINRCILKSAKKGEFHYYWDVIGLSDYMIRGLIEKLEKEGKTVKSKGINFKIINW